jgi:hypothetical protein
MIAPLKSTGGLGDADLIQETLEVKGDVYRVEVCVWIVRIVLAKLQK